MNINNYSIGCNACNVLHCQLWVTAQARQIIGVYHGFLIAYSEGCNNE